LNKPGASDWMKFKVNGHTYDPFGNVISPLRFLWNLAFIKNTHEAPERSEVAARYVRGKLSPVFGLTADILDREKKNVIGRDLPWHEGYKKRSQEEAAHKISWNEYMLNHSMIPVSEGAREIYHAMEEQGVSKPDAKMIMQGIGAMIIGSTGIKENLSPVQRPIKTKAQERQQEATFYKQK